VAIEDPRAVTSTLARLTDFMESKASAALRGRELDPQLPTVQSVGELFEPRVHIGQITLNG
jgi:hypothetical protein